MRDVQAKFKAGRATANIDLMFFLRDWLRTHILQVDKEVGEFLGRGRPATAKA